MQWNKYRAFLAILMLSSGSILTICTKWMDMTESKGLEEVHNFTHPFLQSDMMFAGEMLNLAIFFIAYKILATRMDGSVEENQLTKGSRSFNPLILWPPALMDLFASSMMYIGLTMTNASTFQMLRGSVIIFTAALSKRKVKNYQWVAIVIILFALVLTGLADVRNNKPVIQEAVDEGSIDPILFNDNFVKKIENSSSIANNQEKTSILIGDGLIIVAQLIVAFQMVYEEKYVAIMDIPPLLVVGWEGVFGFFMITLFIAAYGMFPRKMFEDSVEEAFEQIQNSVQLMIGVVLMIFSVGIYNAAGVCVTKEISATTRMVLDSVRTLTVWMFSLMVGWQKFHWLQLVAFILLTVGTFLYNNILILEIYEFAKTRKWPSRSAKQENENSSKDA